MLISPGKMLGQTVRGLRKAADVISAILRASGSWLTSSDESRASAGAKNYASTTELASSDDAKIS